MTAHVSYLRTLVATAGVLVAVGLRCRQRLRLRLC